MQDAVFYWADKGSLKVKSAVWLGDGRWRCFGVVETKMVGEDKQEVHEYDEYILRTALTPERLAARATEPGFLSVRQLLKRVREEPNNLDYRIILHSRFTYPLSGMILLLIGLPPVVGMEMLSRNRFLGAGASISVVVVFWVVTFVCEWLGKQDYLPMPFLAAWLPVVLFGAIGIYLFDTMKT